MKKPFKETKVGKFLSGKGVNLALDAASAFIPGASLLNTVKDAIVGTSDLSEPDKAQAIDLLNQERELFDLEIQDRADARHRELEFVKAGKKDWLMSTVCLVVLAAFAFTVFALAFVEIPEGNKPIMFSIVGTLTMAVGGFCTYYWGSSKGSKEKTKFLTKSE